MKAQGNQETAHLKGEIPYEHVVVDVTSKSPNTKSVRFQRPKAKGKFLFVGNQKFWVRGVTYGTFRPNDEGDQFPDEETVRKDFGLMVSNNIKSYVESVLSLFEHLALRDSMAFACGKDVERYSLDMMVENFSNGILNALEIN